ncbi:electron transfer flavoprotein subunit alpha, mitochondrial [Hordeum vulgare]|nr:electron transfer flavoprotein subunit alpha, mitochondrial [Hordeum vulgare]
MAAPASPGEDMDVEVAAFLASYAASEYDAAEALLDRLDAPASRAAARRLLGAVRRRLADPATGQDCLRRAFNFRIIPDDPRLQQQVSNTSIVLLFLINKWDRVSPLVWLTEYVCSWATFLCSRHIVLRVPAQVSRLIIAEHEGGLVKPSSLSALAAAEAIAKVNKVSLLLGGSGPTLHKAAQHAASSHPLVNEVLVADSDVFAHPLAEPWAELLRSVQQKGGYSHVIASSTSFGKNLLPRAAALLDVSPIMEVTAICEQRVFVRPNYAGNALCTVRYTGESPCMMSIRSISFSPATESMSEIKVAPITQVDLSFLSEASSRKSSWVNLTSQDTERPDLANARVVVTGGRGLKSAENFKLLAQLAEKLGAAVGATRAAVDAGYVPNELQDEHALLCIRSEPHGMSDVGLEHDAYHAEEMTPEQLITEEKLSTQYAGINLVCMIEVILGTTGRKQGTSSKAASLPSTESLLCKIRLAEAFISLEHPLATKFCHEKIAYRAIKDMACEYQQMLELLRKAPFFGRWRAKIPVDSFTVPR